MCTLWLNIYNTPRLCYTGNIFRSVFKFPDSGWVTAAIGEDAKILAVSNSFLKNILDF